MSAQQPRLILALLRRLVRWRRRRRRRRCRLRFHRLFGAAPANKIGLHNKFSGHFSIVVIDMAVVVQDNVATPPPHPPPPPPSPLL